MPGLPVLAAGPSSGAAPLDLGLLMMGLFGGLALFLYGMEKMADALKAVAGARMKSILAGLTTNRVMGALTGAIVTAIIQSSSVTTVLVVGFIVVIISNVVSIRCFLFHSGQVRIVDFRLFFVVTVLHCVTIAAVLHEKS